MHKIIGKAFCPYFEIATVAAGTAGLNHCVLLAGLAGSDSAVSLQQRCHHVTVVSFENDRVAKEF